MAEYEQTATINASPHDVFTFVSDVRNLPQYLPTTKSAQPQEGERVRVQGEAQGHQYDSDGYFRADESNHRLEWGADERYYSGWLEINGNGGSTSDVTVHLSLRGTPPGADESERPPDAAIQEGLEASLKSIQNIVEGQGGKVEPSAAT
jgi:uncharacterized protein YndB with AHSA1/START domain